VTNEFEATGDLHTPTEHSSGRAPDATAPLAPPGYERLEEIGSGGMGFYRARDTALIWVNSR
jgi:hypothetical protein